MNTSQLENILTAMTPPEFMPLVPPQYQEIKRGDWFLFRHDQSTGFCAGYFREVAVLEPYWVLMHGKKVWMSLTPMELESQGYHARMAGGHVLVCGLGMGVLVFNLAHNPNVTRITVVDKDAHVIEMFQSYAKEWDLKNKVTIVCRDAFDYARSPYRAVDTLIVDIWPNLGSEHAERDTLRIQKRVKAKHVAWWGQELDIISFLLDSGRRPPIQEADLKEFQKCKGVNILGAHHPAYPNLILKAGMAVATAQRKA